MTFKYPVFHVHSPGELVDAFESFQLRQDYGKMSEQVKQFKLHASQSRGETPLLLSTNLVFHVQGPGEIETDAFASAH